MIFLRVFRSQSAAALIELAIVVPMLALLLIGLMEMGRYLAFSVRLSNAAHAGAQFGSQGAVYAGNAADVASAACNDSGFSCTTSTPKPGHTPAPNSLFITSSMACSSKTVPCPVGGNFIQVQVSGTFQPMLNYPIFKNSSPMSAQASQQVNGP